MSKLFHKSLLREIGEALELNLEFDDNDQCFLFLDEKLMISIRNLEDSWIFYGMLGNLWHDDPEEAEEIQTIGSAMSLLSLNLALAESGGPSIALEKSSGCAMLVQRVFTEGTTGEQMQDVLGDFVQRLGDSIATLNGDSTSGGNSESTPLPFAHPFFLSV